MPAAMLASASIAQGFYISGSGGGSGSASGARASGKSVAWLLCIICHFPLLLRRPCRPLRYPRENFESRQSLSIRRTHRE